MVQHVLLPVNIHFHWNLLIFLFLTIYLNFFNFYIGGHFENFKNKEHNFEWWSIFVSSFKRFRCTEWI
jgi:Ulp1 family protease